MKKSNTQKLEVITPNTLVVGVDICKRIAMGKICGLSQFGVWQIIEIWQYSN